MNYTQVNLFFRHSRVLKNAVFWNVTSRVSLKRADVSEELIASIIRVERISALGTTLALTMNCRFNC
jgi:hypothetical protein